MRHRPSLPNKQSDELVELSSLLNKLAQAEGISGFERFRNPNGVYMKLMNFLRLDPDYTATGRVGLQRQAKADVAIWNDFAGDPERLHATALAIRTALESGDPPPAPMDYEGDEFTEAVEGRWLSSLHRRRERNRKLVEKRKERALKAYGVLQCAACDFDFAKRYGERGEGYIECHHIKPLADLRPGDRTKLEDLKLVRANCHRMIHARRPWLTLEQLRAIIR
jgi:5-methylcytosine-specific restriction protein A